MNYLENLIEKVLRLDRLLCLCPHRFEVPDIFAGFIFEHFDFMPPYFELLVELFLSFYKKFVDELLSFLVVDVLVFDAFDPGFVFGCSGFKG